MEFLFSQLKQKDVINLNNGKNLGRVCDITVTFPEGKFTGLTVTGCKGFKLTKQDLFIPLNCIVRLGEDAILVKLGEPDKDCNKPPKRPPNKEKCPPPSNCPPPCPPPYPPQDNRRSYDEYE